MPFNRKKMKKGIQKKLNAYAAAAGTIALAGAADAQIAYTDINPDTIIHDSLVFNLDFDNNGQPELRFETVMSTGSSYDVNLALVNVTGNANNAILGSLYAANYPFPFAMNNGDSISGTNTNWRAATVNSGIQYLGVVYGSNTYANFLGVSDKYIGVRFMIGSNTHYGWVRLSVTANADSITIKDYAYEVLPGVGLTAGQLTGIHTPQANSNISIFSSANTVVVNNAEFEKGGLVRIVNTLGETVYESSVNEATMRISLEGKATGIYFVEVVTGDMRTTKKVYIY